MYNYNKRLNNRKMIDNKIEIKKQHKKHLKKINKFFCLCFSKLYSLYTLHKIPTISWESQNKIHSHRQQHQIYREKIIVFAIIFYISYENRLG